MEKNTWHIIMKVKDLLRLQEEIPLDQERYCFISDKHKITFSELKERNPRIPSEELEQYWKNPIIEFMCCTCYSQRDIRDTHLSPYEDEFNFHSFCWFLSK